MHGQKKAARAAAVRFGLVQREISVGEQLIDGGAVIGRNRDAGAAADAHGMLVDLKILCEPVEHCVDNLADETRIAASGATRTNSSPPSRNTWTLGRALVASIKRWPTSTRS